MGAWIETSIKNTENQGQEVAPFMGAWIETCCKIAYFFLRFLSLPSWERGLKHELSHAMMISYGSLPSWERGLKHPDSEQDRDDRQSLPSWERGLKHYKSSYHIVQMRRSLHGSVD